MSRTTIRTGAGALAVAFAAVLALGAGGGQGSRPLRIAAASDLQFAMADIVRAFATASPAIDVDVAYGSSGLYHAQLLQRAPYDMFFSADIAYARDLVDRGHARADGLFVYAVGALALWVANGSPLDLGSSLDVLRDGRVRRIAMANPRHAPYGRAAEAALRRAGLREAVAPKLVLGDNVAQAAQFVQSGAADIGLIARSLAMAPPMRRSGRFRDVPAGTHPPLEQAAVTLAWARDSGAAAAFARFVAGPEGRRILSEHGFDLPAS